MPTSELMKAALLTGYGSPLEIADIPMPTPRPGEILVAVEASGVCFTDVHIWRGEHRSPNPLPIVLGHEGVGTIVSKGSSGGRLEIGDRVGIGYVFAACGHCRECLTGSEAYCRDFDATGFSVDGCFAEYICLREEWVTAIPKELSPFEAAPLMCAGAAAYSSLRKTGVEVGGTVAIFGLGGLGLYAVQLAKASGARVIAVDIDEAKLKSARRFGADDVLKATDDVGSIIQDMGGADGCINFAPVGSTWPQMIAAARRRGRLVLTAVPNDQLNFYASDLIEAGLTVHGSSAASRQEMRQLMRLASDRRINGVVQTRPFSAINSALKDLAAGAVEGRIVLDLAA